VLEEFIDDFKEFKAMKERIEEWKERILTEYDDGEHKLDDGTIITIETVRKVKVKSKKKKKTKEE